MIIAAATAAGSWCSYLLIEVRVGLNVVNELKLVQLVDGVVDVEAHLRGYRGVER